LTFKTTEHTIKNYKALRPKKAETFQTRWRLLPKYPSLIKKTSEFLSKNSHEIHLLTDYFLKNSVISQHQCERCPKHPLDGCTIYLVQ